jgi:V/A-type H+/Na+-transporting ATPase subunit C
MALRTQTLPKFENTKIRLGEYPYTYVRTTVMRTLLLGRDDYERLIKMSVSDVIRFLQETQYKKEIDDLAINYSGTELIEQALNQNLVQSFNKLRSISDSSLLKIIDVYLMRYDFHNLKTILRGKFTKTSPEQIDRLITAAGLIDEKTYKELSKIESYEELLKNRQVESVVPYNYIKFYLEEFKQKQDIAKLENAVDKYYFTLLLNFVSRLSTQGNVFKDFIKTEIEILNILTILRLKRENVATSDIQNFLISSNDPAQDRKIITLLNLQDVSSIITKLQKIGYSNSLMEGIEDFKKSSTLTTLEMDLKRHLLKKTLLFTHQNPLSVDTILSYMFTKDMEVRNLLVLIKCKQFDFDDDFIRSQLVVS